MVAVQSRQICWSHIRWRPSSLPQFRNGYSPRYIRHEAIVLLLLPLLWWLHQIVWQGFVGGVSACRVSVRELPSRRWLVLFILCAAHRSCLASCPQGCDCKWRYGKETVECRNAGFIDIPLDLDPGTQVVDMAHNNLQVLPKDTFLNAGLLNLQRIFLQHCSLKQIDQEAFRRLSNLVELDISQNEMAYIPTAAFQEVADLRRLSMSNNPLTQIQDDAFASLPSLTTLELSNCRIGRVSAHAFRGLENLSFLKLDGNELTVLLLSTVIALRSLHGIHLHGNPWICDCHLRPTRQWMLKYNVPVTVPPSCASPSRLLNVSWDKLPLDDYACETEVEVAESSIDVTEDDNVTLSCWVTGNPAPTVRWIWRNRIIANLSLAANGRQIHIIHEEGSTEKVNNLTITTVQVDNSGVYSCVAENKANKAVRNVTLTVISKSNEEQSLTFAQVCGIIVGFGLFVVLVILMISAVVIKCRRKRRKRRERKRIEIDHHKHMNSINHKDAIMSLEKHNLTFMGPNPVQKTPRLGHYQGVPTTDLDHYHRPLLENSIGPVWVKGESDIQVEEDTKLALTTVMEEDEERASVEYMQHKYDEASEGSSKVESVQHAEVEDGLNENDKQIQCSSEELQQLDECCIESGVNRYSLTRRGTLLEEKEAGSLDEMASENNSLKNREVETSSFSSTCLPPSVSVDPNVPSGSNGNRTPHPQMPLWTKLPPLSPPRGERLCGRVVTVFKDGEDGTQV